GSASVTVDGGATLGFARTDNYTFGKTITGNGSVDISGSGQLVLTAANSYHGGTIVENGTVGIGNDGVFGDGILIIRGGFLRADGAPRTIANTLQLDGDFSLGRLTNFTGSAALLRDVTITSANLGPNVELTSTFSGAISGAHKLTFATGT